MIDGHESPGANFFKPFTAIAKLIRGTTSEEQQALHNARTQIVNLDAQLVSQRPLDPRFEQEFVQRTSINGASGRFDAVDVLPQQTDGNASVIWACGMGGTPTVDKGVIQELYNGNRRVLSADYSTRSGENPFAGEVERQAQTLIDLAEHQHTQTHMPMDAAGQSFGAIALTVAALKRPDLFRNIVLVHSAGLVQNDSVVKLALRQLKETNNLNRIIPQDTAAAQLKTIADKAFWNHIVQDISSAYSELRGASHIPLHLLIQQTRKKGVKVAMIHGVNEEINPMSDVQNNVPQDIDGFYSINAQHYDTQAHPAIYVGEVINHALDALQNQRMHK